VTSTIGAHVHFNQLVSKFVPFNNDVSATDKPLALAMNVNATPTKPLNAPKGT
jgi:protein-disulfide isomerase